MGTRATLSFKIVGTLWCFLDMPTGFHYFPRVENNFKANPLPITPMLANISFSYQNQQYSTALSQGRWDFEQALTFNFVREKYLLFQLILKLSVGFSDHGGLFCFTSFSSSLAWYCSVISKSSFIAECHMIMNVQTCLHIPYVLNIVFSLLQMKNKTSGH